MFFDSKGNLLDFYFTSLQLVLSPNGGRKTSPSSSSWYILYFYFLWDHRAHFGYFENLISLKSMLGGGDGWVDGGWGGGGGGRRGRSMQPHKLHCLQSLNKTEPPIFLLLCFLCFQMQPIRLLIK